MGTAKCIKILLIIFEPFIECWLRLPTSLEFDSSRGYPLLLLSFSISTSSYTNVLPRTKLQPLDHWFLAQEFRQWMELELSEYTKECELTTTTNKIGIFSNLLIYKCLHQILFHPFLCLCIVSFWPPGASWSKTTSGQWRHCRSTPPSPSLRSRTTGRQGLALRWILQIDRSSPSTRSFSAPASDRKRIVNLMT